MKENYKIEVYTANKIGLLQRVALIFTRRQVNIESIKANYSKYEGIHKYVIEICEDRSMVVKLVKQLEKQIDITHSTFKKSSDMKNYFNQLSFQKKLEELGKCSLLPSSEFEAGAEVLKGKKVVVIGCGAQGLNQALNLRDSGLDVSFVLREDAISEQRNSYKNATKHNFKVGTYEELIPKADLVINLTPDKQHTEVVSKLNPLFKKNACLSYSHGFNMVEEGMQVREDVTVIMVAPKCPGTEVRAEYLRGFGVPSLIAVHNENDPNGFGYEWAKAYAAGLGSHRAGVLLSSFVAEVKSDLMGEQTILCGLLQSASLLCFDRMLELGFQPGYASRLVQNGWEHIAEALKIGGVGHMMDRLANEAKLKAYDLAEELKFELRPLFEKHMDQILNGGFSSGMMADWENEDEKLLRWRNQTSKTTLEKTRSTEELQPQSYFDNAVLMVAFVKAGVELAYETMVSAGVKEESAYFESLHELPLIANLVARKKLYEMNKVISDTAEYGCYLFDHACRPLLDRFMSAVRPNVLGDPYFAHADLDEAKLLKVNKSIRAHSIEIVGAKLRALMYSEVAYKSNTKSNNLAFELNLN